MISSQEIEAFGNYLDKLDTVGVAINLFDDMVLENKEKEASEINNAGLNAQVSYLVKERGYSLEYLRDLIRDEQE